MAYVGAKARKNNIYVSALAGEEKNSHPGGRKKIFFCPFKAWFKTKFF